MNQKVSSRYSKDNDEEEVKSEVSKKSLSQSKSNRCFKPFSLVDEACQDFSASPADQVLVASENVNLCRSFESPRQSDLNSNFSAKQKTLNEP